MPFFTVDYEATAFAEVHNEDDIDDVLDPESLTQDEAIDLGRRLVDKGVLPKGVSGVFHAYVTGSAEDFDDDSVKAFICVSLIVEAESIDDAEDLDLVWVCNAVAAEFLKELSIDGEFEFTDSDAVEDRLSTCSDGARAFIEGLGVASPTPGL